MLSEDKLYQYGLPRTEDINCIVIHNTGNYEKSAKELYDYLENECTTTNGTHFLVDHNEVIQVAPLDWAIFNTGNGYDYSFHHSIAIEICSNNDDELYLQGQDKAIELIKELMNEYKIPRSEIYFHKDFAPNFYCPNDILRIYKTKKRFLDTFINTGGKK